MSRVTWFPSNGLLVYGNKTILTIYACASEPISLPPDSAGISKQKNHWALHCVISKSTSIRIEPTPCGADMWMVIDATFEQRALNYEAVKLKRLDATGLTVRGLFDLLESTGCDKFQFSPSGSGRRNWISTVIQLLGCHGFLPNKPQIWSVKEALMLVWAPRGIRVPPEVQTSIEHGSFWQLAWDTPSEAMVNNNQIPTPTITSGTPGGISFLEHRIEGRRRCEAQRWQSPQDEQRHSRDQ